MTSAETQQYATIKSKTIKHAQCQHESHQTDTTSSVCQVAAWRPTEPACHSLACPQPLRTALKILRFKGTSPPGATTGKLIHQESSSSNSPHPPPKSTKIQRPSVRNPQRKQQKSSNNVNNHPTSTRDPKKNPSTSTGFSRSLGACHILDHLESFAPLRASSQH